MTSRLFDFCLAVTKLIGSLIIVLGLQVAIVGHYLMKLNPTGRVAAGISIVLLIIYYVTDNYVLLASGLVIFIALTLWQWRQKRSPRAVLSGSSINET